MSAPDNVRFCPHCKAVTWHHRDVCEWSDSHQSPPSSPSPDYLAGFAQAKEMAK